MKRIAWARHTAVLALAVTSLGCSTTVVPPPSFPDAVARTKPTATVKPRSFRLGDMFAPAAYLDWSGNDPITVVTHRSRVLTGIGIYRANIAFTASLPDLELRCETEPKISTAPSTRFGCWSTGNANEDLTFWIAPDADCPASGSAHNRTLKTPACWRGVLRSGNLEARLFHGFAKEYGTPASWVSWLGPKGELLLAANGEMSGIGTRVNLFHGTGTTSPEAMRKLVLTTVALAVWRDAALSDD